MTTVMSLPTVIGRTRTSQDGHASVRHLDPSVAGIGQGVTLPPSLFGSTDTRQTYQLRRRWFHEQQANDRISSATTLVSSGDAVEDEERRTHGAVSPAMCKLLRACSIMVLSHSVWFSSNAFLGEICEDYGLTKSDGSILTVAVNLGFAVAAATSACLQLPDSVPTARLLSIGSWGCVVSNAVLSMGFPYSMLIAARFMNGVALAFVYPITMRFVSSCFSSSTRGLPLGCVIGSLTVGIALPSLLKGLFPDSNWRVVTLGMSALAAVAAVLSCNTCDGPHVPRPSECSVRNLRLVIGRLDWWLVTLSYVGHNVELFGGWAWMGEFLESYLRARGSDDAQEADDMIAPFATFAVVAAGGIGAVAGGWVSNHIGRRCLIILAHFTSGTTIAILPFASRFAPLAVVFALAGCWGVSVIADSAQYSALLSDVLPEQHLLGTAISFSLALGFTSTAVGIYAVPILFEWAGWDGAFPCLAVGPALGALAMLAVPPGGRGAAAGPRGGAPAAGRARAAAPRPELGARGTQ